MTVSRARRRVYVGIVYQFAAVAEAVVRQVYIVVAFAQTGERPLDESPQKHILADALTPGNIPDDGRIGTSETEQAVAVLGCEFSEGAPDDAAHRQGLDYEKTVVLPLDYGDVGEVSPAVRGGGGVADCAVHRRSAAAHEDEVGVSQLGIYILRAAAADDKQQGSEAGKQGLSRACHN